MSGINFIELKCRRCGGQLQAAGTETYICLSCGKTFEKQIVINVADEISRILSEQKQETVAGLRRQLWAEMHEKYINSQKIISIAREIKKYLPDDYFASFCEIANGGSPEQVNAFLKDSPQSAMTDYADIVINFMLKSLTAANLNAVSLFIGRAFADDPESYDKYITLYESEAQKVNGGIYELILTRDVFLAYSSADIDKVVELCDFLESNGISCFLSLRNLRHGRGAVDNYERAINTAIDNCKTVVFVSSTRSRSLACDALTKELQYIKQKDLEGAPAEYKRAYGRLPAEYMVPRAEYLIEEYTGCVAEGFVKEFFHGLEWCKSKEAVAERITKYLTETPRGARRYCTNCGAENKIGARFCFRCGGRLVEILGERAGKVKFCAACGAENSAENAFCTECGSQFAPESGIIISGGDKSETADGKGGVAESDSDPRRVGEYLAKGMLCYDEKNYERAAHWFRKAAELGDMVARYNLGTMYEHGRGVEQNYGEAVKWYRKAAEQGSAEAQNNLGSCYYDGKGVPKDYGEAVKLFRKAAEKGHAGARYNLGTMYENGRGVPQDYAEAVKWYTKAAEQGDAEAWLKLGVCRYYGRGVRQDYAEAVKYFKQAAGQGHVGAMTWVGICYMDGRGVCQDYAEAVKWYLKAAGQGDELAQNNLGVMYAEGRGVTLDNAEAFRWYRKAAEQGRAAAQYNLGNCYYEGLGTSRDYAEAVKWYLKAAEQGEVNAQKKLARCYLNGYGVDKNFDEAVKWLRAAAANGDEQIQKWLDENRSKLGRPLS